MNHRTPISQYWLVLLALAAIFSAPTPARAQSQTMSPQASDNDVTHRQLADFDRFLDNHAELASQLRKDPSLINNEEFVENHADLQQYLQQHPEIRQELSQNPNSIMHQENRYDRREDQARDRDHNSDRDRNRDRDVTRPELANMDRFLDSHPEIAEQLKRDPSLVNNQKFAANHPALQQFLAEHPGVREEYKENPNAFMRQENRFDYRQDSVVHGNRDLNRGELSSFNEFLGNHNNISGELSKNPTLANNHEYLENHPALRDYLQAHPQVQQGLSENPQSFLKSAQQLNPATTATPATAAASKPVKAPLSK
jgi:GrpB-like predicted nucleotidyltransferase (UPF0157 family)